MSDFTKNDHVSWNTSQGKTTGVIMRKITSDTSIEGNKVTASKDEPQYEVKSDSTGKHAIHKPEALHRIK